MAKPCHTQLTPEKHLTLPAPNSLYSPPMKRQFTSLVNILHTVEYDMIRVALNAGPTFVHNLLFRENKHIQIGQLMTNRMLMG